MADLTLLTAREAARALDVDPKTFRKLEVPYIMVGKTRRYTRAILSGWLERSVQQCKTDQSAAPKVVRFPASSILPSGRAPKFGKSPSASATPDFEQVAGLRTE